MQSFFGISGWISGALVASIMIPQGSPLWAKTIINVPISDCSVRDSVLTALTENTDVLVLGEIHGSTEIPAFALGAVCAAAQPGKPIMLALEIWTSEQENINHYLASRRGTIERLRLLESDFWQHVDDGRSSIAMLDLIDGIGDLIQQGFEVQIVCFDERQLFLGETRDAAMGRFLLKAIHEYQPELAIVLTGNVHARTTIGTPWDPELRPMSSVLRESPLRLNSLNVRHAGGSFWACAPECGLQKFSGAGVESARGVKLFSDIDELGFNGLFDVGVTTASVPAITSPLQGP